MQSHQTFRENQMINITVQNVQLSAGVPCTDINVCSQLQQDLHTAEVLVGDSKVKRSVAIFVTEVQS